MCCGKSCDRYAVDGATDEVESYAVAVFDARRVSAVFTADTGMDVRSRLSSAVDGDFHEFADAFAVEYGERVFFEDFAIEVVAEEFAFGVVTAEA